MEFEPFTPEILTQWINYDYHYSIFKEETDFRILWPLYRYREIEAHYGRVLKLDSEEVRTLANSPSRDIKCFPDT